MAIAVDATSEGYANSTSLTYSHTCTGSDRVLTVALWTFPSGDTVTGITYNGTAMTKLGTQSADAGGYTNLWGIANPSTGANNIVISMSSSQVFATSASYTGCNTTTPFPDTEAGGSGSGTSLSASISISVNNSWLILAGRSPSRVPTAGANTIVRKTNGTSGDAGWLLDSGTAMGTGTQSLNWSYSPSATTYHVIGSIAPATASTTFIPRISFIM